MLIVSCMYRQQSHQNADKLRAVSSSLSVHNIAYSVRFCLLKLPIDRLYILQHILLTEDHIPREPDALKLTKKRLQPVDKGTAGSR